MVGDYVRTCREFELLPRVPLALKKLREWAPHLVIVTNQQGIGKGLMGAEHVDTIHQHLGTMLTAYGVVIDGFQVCPHLGAEGCICRKPNPRLVLDWLAQNPEIDPGLGIIVGDSPSDLSLALRVAENTGGCAGLQIGAAVSALLDASFDSLWDLAVSVGRAQDAERPRERS